MTKDRIEIFGERLKRLVEGIETMKHFGLDEEILVSWLVHRLKVSERKAREIIKCQDEFFSRLMKEEIINKFKKDEK